MTENKKIKANACNIIIVHGVKKPIKQKPIELKKRIEDYRTIRTCYKSRIEFTTKAIQTYNELESLRTKENLKKS